MGRIGQDWAWKEGRTKKGREGQVKEGHGRTLLGMRKKTGY